MLHSGVVQIAFYNIDQATAQTSELYQDLVSACYLLYHITTCDKCDPMNKYEEVSMV